MLVGSYHAVASLNWPGSKISSTSRSKPRAGAVASTCASSTLRPATANLNPSRSLYDALGLSCRATAGDIKAAYRKLARSCHPDVVGSEDKNESTLNFIAIHQAYSTLSDPHKRAEYDRRNMVVLRTMVYGRRTWETDQCW